MYSVTVPVNVHTAFERSKEETLRQILRFDAKRVFISVLDYPQSNEEEEKILAHLRELNLYYKENGLETAAWLSIFNCECAKHSFTPMRSIEGKDFSGHACPSDPNFREYAGEYLKKLALTGVDMILFDDDFRYGYFGGGPACLCERHMDHIGEILGEKVSREQIRPYLDSGEKNRFRDAYLRANGEAMNGFSRAMREAVDQVSPEVRIGFCACLSSWDIDGIDPVETAKILAGNTRPFIRLIGAPYWAVNGSFGGVTLADVIELERMESAWTRNGEIEIVSEGDAYPRPRIATPASYLEGFDTALRAAGCTDGILKYGIDYLSDPDYEQGYAEMHEHNRELYGQIESAFDGKNPVGIRVWTFPQKIAGMKVPTAVFGRVGLEETFYHPVSKVTAHGGLPTAYEGDGMLGICFGENARSLPDEALDSGMILDTAAAEILKERGFDVGIEQIGAPAGVRREIEEKSGNRVQFSGVITFALTLSEGAKVLSRADDSGIPLSILYENAKGQRFLLLNFDTRMFSKNDSSLKHYLRAKQIEENAEWLSGKPLPAVCTGHPSLYLQCKEKDGKKAVGLWNFYPDPVYSPVVALDKKYRAVRFIGCTGRLEGNRVTLSDISPFGFAGFEVEE